MDKKIIDAKGLACPQPVVLTKNALVQIMQGEVCVLVDNETARDNVSRFAASQGCSVSVSCSGESLFEVLIKKDGACAACQVSDAMTEKIVYLFDADYVGTNMELGKVLMNGFLTAMQNLQNKHCAIVLISNAVRLATEGSYVLEVLKGLEKAGFGIFICGTCLNFYKIRDNVRVGTISNALEILECLTGAAKIIKF
ncbi:MAG: sulfurtransferase-like selenium metabolism protein YedF [Deltaproteobacteria bacterium]|nr:sulfurtransferase-like selenium metabolism protein YedF [Deltaproteobacteria bacterium]